MGNTKKRFTVKTTGPEGPAQKSTDSVVQAWLWFAFFQRTRQQNNTSMVDAETGAEANS